MRRGYQLSATSHVSRVTRHVSRILLSTCFLLLLLLPQRAVAQIRPVMNHDISMGHLVINHELYGFDFLVTGSTEQYQIIVGAYYQGTITLSNVSITSALVENTFTNVLCGNGTLVVKTASCMAVMGLNGSGPDGSVTQKTNLNPVTKVNIVLEGDNLLYYPALLSGSVPGPTAYAAIQVDQGAQINISAIDPCNDNSGTLFARATSGTPGVDMGTGLGGSAGIGAVSANRNAYNSQQGSSFPLTGSACNTDRPYTCGGNVVISSGTVTAWGGHAAGIGGSHYTYYDGVVLIVGGNVVSRGSTHAAGIGSGCPTGGGVIDCTPQNSTIIALPPAKIEAYGATTGGQLPASGLAGTKFITYLGDPNRPIITISTATNEANADIYIDFSNDPFISSTFATVYPEFQIDKIWIGRTDATGVFQIRGWFQNPVRIFTDAPSTSSGSFGRPFADVIATTSGSGTNSPIVLPLLDVDIKIDRIYPIPLCVGYSQDEADAHASHIKLENSDSRSFGVLWEMNPATDFDLIFFDASGNPITKPTTIGSGGVIHFSTPLKAGKPENLYSETLKISLVMGSDTIAFTLDLLQRVGCSSFDVLAKVSPAYYAVCNGEKVELALSMTLPDPVDECGVSEIYPFYSYYYASTEPDIEAVLANSSVIWNELPYTETGAPSIITTVSFVDSVIGNYYIHWYAESGADGASGTFGPYQILDCSCSSYSMCSGSTVVFTDLVRDQTPGAELFFYESDRMTEITNLSRTIEEPGLYLFYVQAVLNGCRSPMVWIAVTVKDCNIRTQVLTCEDSTVVDMKPYITLCENPTNFKVKLGSSGTTQLGATVHTTDTTIIYYWKTIGTDVLDFTYDCEEMTTPLTLAINVLTCPCDSADCVRTDLPSTPLAMKHFPIISNTRVESYSQPYAGILYDDGKMKFITHNYLSEGVSNGLLIFDDNLRLETTILFANAETAGSHASPTSGALAVADVDGDGFAEIFVIVGPDNANASLTCYKYNPVTKAWALEWSNRGIPNANISSKSTINIGDINDNGNIQILADHKIFNAKTGALLLELPILPKGEKPGDSNVRNLLADMRNNGRLNVAAGTTVYELKISNYTDITGNSYSTPYQLLAGSLTIGGVTYPNDGYTSVADLDLDGYSDVIITTSTANRAYMYAWNPQTFSMYGTPVLVNSSDGFSSVACIGDVDGDDFPEVVVTYTNGMSCWKINPITKKQFMPAPLWSRNDFVNANASTGATMFDFYQDGKQKIVYRDEQWLRIIDGQTGFTLDSLPCFSPTAVEYPIIVDADNSGNTKIVVSGGVSAADSPDNIRLMMFSPAIPGTWAPSRKTWNQYMYNVVNINNDLTVPRVQINSTTVFSNGKRLYNNFLSQQTLFDQNGDLLWTLPNIVWVNEGSRPTLTIVKGDSVVITGCIKNIGDAGLFSPIYVTFYKNDTTCNATNFMYVDSINTTLAPGQETCFRFVIKKIMTKWPDVDSVWVSINDKGMAGGCEYPFQRQCETDGRRPIRIVNCPLVTIPTYYTDSRPACGEPNGCIVFFPHGGTGGYEFQITPTPAHLAPPPAWNLYTDSIVCGLRSGTYTIFARDTAFRMCEPAQVGLNLKADSTTLQLVTKPVAAVTCSESDSTGKILVASSGGVGAHTYTLEKWVGASLVPVTPLVMNSTGDTILKLNAGSYVVTVTDAIHCTQFNPVDINSGDAQLTITPIAVLPTICEADTGSVTFKIESNSPYWYYLQGGELNGTFPVGSSTHTLAGLGAMSDFIIAYNECMARDTLPFTIERSGFDDLFVSAVHTNVQEFCAGNEEPGSITLTITGGAPPYEYSYMFNGSTSVGTFYAASGNDTTLTGLAIGTYSISVTDTDDCHFNVSSIKIGSEKAQELRIRSIYAGKQPSTCSACDGSIILFPEGGSGGYEYNITPAPAYLIPPTSYLPYVDSLVVDLCAGSYVITVRDTNWRSCPTAARGPITLSDSSTLFVSLKPIPATDCGPTGALVVTVSGGTAVEYTYYLAGEFVNTLTTLPAGDTIFGLVPGKYHIKVLSADGCVAISEPVQITASGNMSVQMVSTHSTPCEAANGIATFSVTNLSGAPFTYSYELFGGSIWNVTTPLAPDSTRNHTILNLGAGTNYTIVVTNACGVATTTFDINNHDGALKVSAVATTMKQFCNAAQELGTIRLTITDGTPPYQYTYILNGSTIAGIFHAALSTDTLFTGFANGDYDIKVTDANGCTSDANNITVGIELAQLVTITAVTATPDTICSDGTSIFTNTLSSGYGDAAFQWQYKNSGTWEDVVTGVPTGALYEDANTSTLTVSNIEEAGTHEYRLSVTMVVSGCKVVSDSAVVTVFEKPTFTAAVATPDSICPGETSTLTSSLSNSYGDAVFQWQYKHGGTWEDVVSGVPTGALYANANTSTLTVSDIEAIGNHEYRLSVIRTISGCKAVSDSATVTVNPLPPTPTIYDPACDPPPSGGAPQTATITIKAPVSGPYKYSLTGGTENRPFQTSPVFAAVPNGSYTIAVIDTNTTCIETNSSILVNCNCSDQPELALETKDTVTCAKNTITIGGNFNYATGVTITSNGAGLATPSASTPSFTIVYTPLDADIGKTITIWVTTDIVNPCVAKMDSVKIKVDSVSVGGAISEDQTICKGGTPEPLTLNGYVGNVLRWEYSIDNFVTFNPVSGTTGFLTLSSDKMGALDTTTYYRAVVQSGVCLPVYSDTAIITVIPKPVLSLPTATLDTICTGGTNILISNLTGGTGTPTFQWQYKNSGIWTDVVGVIPMHGTFSNANTEVLTVASIIATGSHEYRLFVFMTGNGCSAVSDSITVTVNPLPPTPTIYDPVCDPPPSGGAPQTATITIKTPVSGPYKYSLTGGTENRSFQTSPVFAAVPNGSYTIAVQDTSTTCIETNSSILINCNCPNPPELTLETKDTVTCAKNTITIEGNFNYATGVTITSNGAGLATPSASTPSFTIEYTPLDADIGKTITIWVTTDVVAPCVAKMDSVKIRVNSVSVGGAISEDQTICKGDTPDPLTLNGHVGSVLKWQYSDDNFGSDLHDIANTSATLTSAEMGSLSADRYYRAVVQSGVCAPTYSDTVLITTGICACVSEPEIVLATDQATTCVSSAITIDNNLFAGSATAIDIIKSNGAGTLAYTSASTSPFTIKYTPHSSDAGKVITITVISNNPSGAPCVPATATLNITIIGEPTITITSTIGTASQTLRAGATLANIIYATKNTVGVTVTNLPPGVNYTWLNDVLTISGAPTDTGTFQYTITATGICGTAMATGIIIVKEACPVTVHDAANNITYNVVELVGFCWYKENMYGAKYQDETNISFAQPYVSSLYPNTAQNTIDFGLLYTYKDLTGGTLCPAGWRLPTSEEWALLNIHNINDLRNPIYWLQPGNNTNILDFDARGAGYYNSALQRFEDLYGYTAWWSSDASLSNTTIALGAVINYYCSNIEIVTIKEADAISIRCLMDD